MGAAVKRTVDALVAKGMDIQNGARLYENLSKVKSVTLKSVTDEEISEVKRPLTDDLQIVKGTMKIHHVCNNAAPLNVPPLASSSIPGNQCNQFLMLMMI